MFETLKKWFVHKHDPMAEVTWVQYFDLNQASYTTTPTVEKAIELYGNAVSLPNITGLAQDDFDREIGKADRDISRDGWAFILRDNLTRELRRVDPTLIQPVANPTGKLLGYRLTADYGRWRIGHGLSFDEVCQFPYRTEFPPQSAVQKSRPAIDLFNAVLQMNMRVFKTGMLGAPIAIVKGTAMSQTERETLKRRLGEYASDDSGNRDPIVIGGDVEIIKPESPGRTLFLQEAIDQHRKLVGDAFVMQGALLGDNDSATFTNQGLYDSEFWVFAIVPRLEMYRSELRSQLGVEIDYDFSHLPENPMGSVAESGGAAQIQAFG